VADASLAELRNVRGIGPAKAVEIKAALSLGSRLNGGNRLRNRRLVGPAAIALAMRDSFAGKRQEEFHVLLLDAKNRLIRDELVTKGLVDRSQVHAREVFRSAIRESCSRVVLVHNHPSGDPTPSAPDVSATAMLVKAGNVVGISVMDHVILGSPSPERPMGYLSMREEKLVFK
jgi:DNA repair protein RadC